MPLGYDDLQGGRRDRMNASKDRLRELYHEEINPRFQMPHIPGARWILAISLIILTIFSATVLYKFNAFIMMQEEVLAKRGHLEGAFQRRANLFENLLKLTLNHASLEHAVFSHVADARKDIIKKIKLPPEVEASISRSIAAQENPDFDDFSKVLREMSQSGMEQSLGRLLGLAEQYPDIKSSQTYKEMMTSLVHIEDRIAERRMAYQEKVRIFNTEISNFPWYILAEVTRFRRFDYFVAEDLAHRRPEIHRSIFEQLLPFSTENGHGARRQQSKDEPAEAAPTAASAALPAVEKAAIQASMKSEPEPESGPVAEVEKE
jgi:LemA protein